jgi:hypothetical protein
MLNMAAVDYNAEKGILSNIALYFNGIILKITIIKISNVLVYYLHFRSENLLCNLLQCYCIRRMPYWIVIFVFCWPDNAKRFLAEFYVDSPNGKEFKYGEQLVCDIW